MSFVKHLADRLYLGGDASLHALELWQVGDRSRFPEGDGTIEREKPRRFLCEVGWRLEYCYLRALPTFANNPFVLAEHDVPAVVPPDVVASVCTQARGAGSRPGRAASGTPRIRRDRRRTDRRCCAGSARPARPLRALTSTGVPTAIASSASSDRLSTARADDDGRGFERLQPLASESRPANRTHGSSGQRHQLDAHQRQRRVAALLHVAAEVFDQLLAALAGVDAAAVERERPVQAMAAPERAPRAADATGIAAAARLSPSCSVGAVVSASGVGGHPRMRLLPCGRSTPQPTTSSSERRERRTSSAGNAVRPRC